MAHHGVVVEHELELVELELIAAICGMIKQIAHSNTHLQQAVHVNIVTDSRHGQSYLARGAAARDHEERDMMRAEYQ